MKASEISPKKLVVFDIDDTLVHTQTKVHVVKDGEIIDSLNSHDFTHYRLKPGEEFDFSGFRNAREFFEKSKPIIPMMNQLKRDIATGNKVVMVTARADFDDKELFLDTFRKFGIDMGRVHVYRAGNSKEGTTEERKKSIIKSLLDRGDYTKAIMYDDAKPNLHTFMELKRDHPQTNFYAWHVSLEGEASEYMRESVAEAVDPDTFEDLDSRIIARAAKQIVPTIRAKNTPEGYVHVTTEDGLDLYIGAGVADGVISVYIGSGGGVTTSGARKGAVTEIIRSVYHAAVRKYGEPDTPGELTIDHDAGHGVWQHIADKLGLTYAAVKVKESGIRPDDVSENFADGKKPGRKGLAKRSGVNTKASVSSLRKTAKNSSGEKARMAHWLANMKAGRAKKNK